MSRRVQYTLLSLLLATALLLPAALGGCGSARPNPRRFFSLAPPAPTAARVGSPPTLRVRELDCATPYDQAGIVFRVSPVEVRSYRYNSWTAAPGVMVSEVLRRYLAASGRFNLVEDEDQAELELGGRIDVIEQLSNDGEWYGRLEVVLTLRRVRDGRVYWRQRIDGSRPAESNEVSEVVAAQSLILGAALAQELDAISRAANEALAGPPAGSTEPLED